MTDPNMALDPETVLLRRRVLNGEALKRAAKSTSAMTSGSWKHISADPVKPKLEPEFTEAEIAQAKEALAAGEPILVFLSEKELEHCQSWEAMVTVLSLKGVPYERLNNRPDIRTSEKDGGILLEIL